MREHVWAIGGPCNFWRWPHVAGGGSIERQLKGSSQMTKSVEEGYDCLHKSRREKRGLTLGGGKERRCREVQSSLRLRKENRCNEQDWKS